MFSFSNFNSSYNGPSFGSFGNRFNNAVLLHLNFVDILGGRISPCSNTTL